MFIPEHRVWQREVLIPVYRNVVKYISFVRVNPDFIILLSVSLHLQGLDILVTTNYLLHDWNLWHFMKMHHFSLNYFQKFLHFHERVKK